MGASGESKLQQHPGTSVVVPTMKISPSSNDEKVNQKAQMDPQIKTDFASKLAPESRPRSWSLRSYFANTSTKKLEPEAPSDSSSIGSYFTVLKAAKKFQSTEGREPQLESVESRPDVIDCLDVSETESANIGPKTVAPVLKTSRNFKLALGQDSSEASQAKDPKFLVLTSPNDLEIQHTADETSMSSQTFLATMRATSTFKSRAGLKSRTSKEMDTNPDSSFGSYFAVLKSVKRFKSNPETSDSNPDDGQQHLVIELSEPEASNVRTGGIAVSKSATRLADSGVESRDLRIEQNSLQKDFLILRSVSNMDISGRQHKSPSHDSWFPWTIFENFTTTSAPKNKAETPNKQDKKSQTQDSSFGWYFTALKNRFSRSTPDPEPETQVGSRLDHYQ